MDAVSSKVNGLNLASIALVVEVSWSTNRLHLQLANWTSCNPTDPEAVTEWCAETV
jgi:hypothetical protein